MNAAIWSINLIGICSRLKFNNCCHWFWISHNNPLKSNVSGVRLAIDKHSNRLVSNQIGSKNRKIYKSFDLFVGDQYSFLVFYNASSILWLRKMQENVFFSLLSSVSRGPQNRESLTHKWHFDRFTKTSPMERTKKSKSSLFSSLFSHKKIRANFAKLSAINVSLQPLLPHTASAPIDVNHSSTKEEAQ